MFNILKARFFAYAAVSLLIPICAQAADTASGALDGSSPTYNRIFTGNVDPNCNAVSTFSGVGTGIYYQVFEIHSPAGENADIEIINSTVSDTTISLYCSFDPTDASLGLVAYDDDGGTNLLSALDPGVGATLQPDTVYYLVVSTFGPGDIGTFDVVLGGDLLFGAPAPAAPPPAPPAPPAPPEPVPTLGTWGLMLLSGLLAGLAGWSQSRQRRIPA